ncbi:A/G-specific adenine glycosylase [Geomonas paludis]|uniref:Adenine DNA glycosylase n=1 Tax=Geomonas paludis TaxID=2740185 RepID=A0A6V8N0Z3_9BACT|nr:A/G-specific adenine glycosylase [Geomonas paludis]UPU36337.1 A/G-specific adenine glycosylase [Geomonas paludis]GFO66168.1 endonuclease III [Geomonas paludis]
MDTPVTTEDVNLFRNTVLDHYRTHGRRLPWRETRDPYAILVSEIMLQQTQVDRVREKYLEFLAVFPTLRDLAQAELSRVLSVWQGLGYNRRAVSLQQCARVVLERFHGTLPREVVELESLPGIGPYTARAVAAFAFDVATPFIETNIRSVFIQHFFPDRDLVRDADILPLVGLTLDRDDPRRWYYALMDYGAHLKRGRANPGRKSAHHVRQSPFRGSNREQRSLILRSILAEPGVTRSRLEQELRLEAALLARNLEQLEKEGFIREESDRLWIA